MDQVLKVGKPIFADMTGSFGQGTHYIAVTFDDGFKNFIDNALPIMLTRQIPAMIFVPTGYIGRYPEWIENPDHENTQEVLMTDDELKNLPQDMVRIGSHCVSHPRLTLLTKKQIIYELSESKKQLELLLEKNVTTLAYPYDDYNDQIIELAQEAGYSRVFKDVPTYPTSQMRGFFLGRISTTPEDWGIEYWLKLRGAYQWLPLAVKCKRCFQRSKSLKKLG